MPEPARAGFVAPVLYRAGGTESWHTTLFDHLDRDRVIPAGVAVVLPDECDSVLAGRLGAAGIPVYAGPDAAARLAPSCDVLVTWGLGRLDEILPPRPGRPPVVTVSHGDATSLWQGATLAAADRDTDFFVAVARAALGPIPEHRRPGAAVLPNGIDPDRLRPRLTRSEQRRRWGVRPGAKVLGFLGRFSPEKNPVAPARALPHLSEEWVAVWVGDGLDWHTVRGTAYSFGGTRCYFPGVSEDVGSALAAFDVLAVPSHQEGFGLSAVEGVMARVPTVMTPVGVALEHPDWFYAVPKDPSGPALAEKVLAADSSPDAVRADLAREARALYSAEAFGRRWSDFLAHVARPR